MAERFLEVVSPRFSRQAKLQMKYELVIFLDIVKKHVTDSKFIEILEEIKQMDAAAICDEYDSKLGHE
jgi:hypothetical protein